MSVSAKASTHKERTLIRNARVVNEGRTFTGSVLIQGQLIAEVREGADTEVSDQNTRVVDAQALLLMPGAIDDQVHFREPGLTHKADIHSESRAAVAGGVTSFMEMPNTNPQTVTQDELWKKYELGARSSVANYSFFMGATNDNLDQVLATDARHVCGIKVFMGSSTGNMLVDRKEALEALFSKSPMLIATHCEDEATIRANSALYREKFGDNVPWSAHPLIRSAEACYASSSMAVELAKRHDTRLHILHISTAKECGLFENRNALSEKRITSEACIHHLWFTDADYQELGSKIKWNPAVKSASDRDEIWRALLDNRIDIVATDHAPHTKDEKAGNYWSTPSGGPLVQHAVQAMLELVVQGRITVERMVEKMCHAPATCFSVRQRGFIRPGYFADLVLVDPSKPQRVTADNLLYKCGWSPFENQVFSHSIHRTYVNGAEVFSNGVVVDSHPGMALEFSR